MERGGKVPAEREHLKQFRHRRGGDMNFCFRTAVRLSSTEARARERKLLGDTGNLCKGIQSRRYILEKT